MVHAEFRGLIRYGARLVVTVGAVAAYPMLASAQSAKPTPTFTKDVAKLSCCAA